ncbi:Fc.00g060790.m01.CDS01 [Cosmosporella sp. VM-42]
MQTVPSLVGTGTAIAAAASGLVFGQPTEPNLPPNPRASHKRRISLDHQESNFHPRLGNFPLSRPATSTAAPLSAAEGSHYHTLPRPSTASRPPLSRYQRPQSTQFTPPKVTSRKSSFVRQGEPPAAIPEAPRDSVSSNGSWIRRLSIRPLSHHGSTRSSTGPDSPSITFSHGSSAPILGPSTQPLPPNKLVKRAPSTQYHDPDALPRRRSKSHLPTLRRPATSHQRSATLQQRQLQPDSNLATPISPRKFSFDDPSQPHEFLAPSAIDQTPGRAERGGWASFFHSKTSTVGGRSGSGRFSDLGPHARPVATRRICIENDPNRRVHLVKPSMVSAGSAPPKMMHHAEIEEEAEQPVKELKEVEALEPLQSPIGSPDVTPSRVPRKSVSMPFASAGSWVSKTSGSIRRPKQRGANARSGNKRHVSDPVTGAQPGFDAGTNTPQESTSPSTSSPLAPGKQGSALGSATIAQLRTRKRNSSSPLPPLSRLSSFNVDISRLGSSGGSGGAPIHQTRPNQPSGSSTSSTAMSQLLRAQQHDRTSTMESSEGDTREFTSGDDDDTDFKSDTMFDSIRTVASGRARAVETPLESMYDESPPSTAGNGKTKRLSIQEILGRSWDGDDNRIMEEDESLPTPVRTVHRTETIYTKHDMSPGPRFSLQSPPNPNDVSISTKEFSRLSLDDDFDDDWARDDDIPCNPLSPPSKGSSLNSKGINPNVRLALASISGNGNGVLEVNNDNHSERPLSNIFDWSEPSHDKHEVPGRSPRPKTAYAKQEMDSRGGRSTIRKGPTPTHVRSQSVPVVHDLDDDSKPVGAKYGTWGMGTKTVSEDWDDDFEFGGGSIGSGDRDDKAFAVPESIRATQPSVKAHSGQIRELSLLVNDLKRLCRHGREMDMLDGAHRILWKEAEGIIALASPDEDEDEDSVSEHTDSTSSINFDAFDIDENFGDDGFDAHSMDRLDAAFDGHEPTMSRTTVVRERYSPRRRSVFSPEDDIFGNWPVPDGSSQTNRQSRPRTPENRSVKPHDVNGVVRSVMEAMHRSASDPAHEKDGKMHFDTNSLKVLVKRAGDLRDILSDMIRRADQITQSPARTPRHERQLESSPAFTRVFDDPGSSPPRRILKSRGNNSIMDDTSPGNSPSSSLPRRLQMMTVS